MIAANVNVNFDNQRRLDFSNAQFKNLDRIPSALTLDPDKLALKPLLD